MELGIDDPRPLVESIISEKISRGITAGTIQMDELDSIVTLLHRSRLLPEALCEDLFLDLTRNCAFASDKPFTSSNRKGGYGLSNEKLRGDMKRLLRTKLEDINYILRYKKLREIQAYTTE